MQALIYSMVFAVIFAGDVPAQADFYVSTLGNDNWTGKLKAPKADNTDGPFATFQRAQAAVRLLKKLDPGRKQPIEVTFRGGKYNLAKPILISPEDSGTPDAPVIYHAYEKEKPVFTGGLTLTGWKQDAAGRWQIEIPDAATGKWNFSQLFINGERRYRPRLPKNGYYRIAGTLPPSESAVRKGYDRFRFHTGEIRADWHNLKDIESLCFQNWTMARLRIASVDQLKDIVNFTGPTQGMESYSGLPKGNRYLIENVKEALTESGEWYLDRSDGLLAYIPMNGESFKNAEIIAPKLERLVEFRGDLQQRKWVENIHFQGLAFEHTNWNALPIAKNSVQAEVELSAAITLLGARNCVLRNCSVSHIGNSAVEIGAGSQQCRLDNCEFTDLGGGGVKIGETAIREDPDIMTKQNSVTNCLIEHAGRLHPASVGIWIGASPDNQVFHNEIRDLYYTGVSVGWTWGYGKSIADHNTIEYNYISNIGQGVLSDMGGIYTLGSSPGTTLRNNLIHDVESADYGGWGIYPDEGSSGLLIENNIVYNTKTGGFHQHYGKENIVRNNIFANSNEAQLVRSRAEDHLSFNFNHNIVFWKQGELLGANWTGSNFKMDYNIYWSAPDKPVTFSGMDIGQWRQKGQDLHSLIADPQFVDSERHNFDLRTLSPAYKLGFQKINTLVIGREPHSPARHLATTARRAFPPLPPLPPPEPILEGFETTSVGAKIQDGVTSEENEQATVRVTDETAATGKHSLKFQDMEGQKFSYNPHIYYDPKYETGLIDAEFSIRVEPGALFYHEWRDSSSPYHTGPSINIGLDGTLIANGRKMQKILLGKWFRIHIVCGLGAQATGKYDITIIPPGGISPVTHRDIACSPDFKALRWYGFVSNSDWQSVFYLDDIALHPRSKE